MRLLLPNAVLKNLDVAEILAKWDMDQESEMESNKLIDIVGNEYDKSIDGVREMAFKKVFNATMSHDLSAYICEDLGLILRCDGKKAFSYWLEKRESIYIDGYVPFMRLA